MINGVNLKTKKVLISQIRTKIEEQRGMIGIVDTATGVLHFCTLLEDVLLLIEMRAK